MKKRERYSHFGPLQNPRVSRPNTSGIVLVQMNWNGLWEFPGIASVRSLTKIPMISLVTLRLKTC